MLIWLHCINVVSECIARKELSLKVNYKAGNLIGIATQLVCSAWTVLLSNASTDSVQENESQRGTSTWQLSHYLLPYLRFNDKTGCFEAIKREDGFSNEKQFETLVPSMPAIPVGGVGIADTAARRSVEKDGALRYLSQSFLGTLSSIVTNNEFYKFDESNVLDNPHVKPLHEKTKFSPLPLVFCDMDDGVMGTLNISKPVYPQTEDIDVDNPAQTVPKNVSVCQDGKVPPNAQITPVLKRKFSKTPTSVTGKKRARCPSPTDMQGPNMTVSTTSSTYVPTAVKEEPMEIDTVLDVHPKQNLAPTEEIEEAYKILTKNMSAVCATLNVHFADLRVE